MLHERGELGISSGIDYLLSELEYPLDLLEEHFGRLKRKELPEMDPRLARIVAIFLDVKLAELREMLEEVDREYASDEIDV